jgi:hypothetical protein
MKSDDKSHGLVTLDTFLPGKLGGNPCKLDPAVTMLKMQRILTLSGQWMTIITISNTNFCHIAMHTHIQVQFFFNSGL